MKGTEVFVHTNLFVERAPGLFLPLINWRILHALDGFTDVESLAARLHIEPRKLATLMEELQKDGWIEEHVLSLSEFEDFLKNHSENASTHVAHTPPSADVRTNLSTPETPRKKSGRVVRISRVIDFLNANAPNPLAAQATIYLVFSRLPRELVEREGLSTIHLINDPTQIESQELQEALTAVIYSVVQQRLPETIFENR